MPLLVELWADTLVGNLFAPDSILSKATDYSEFVSGKKVHVPNAGTPAKITKNPSEFPVAVGERKDADVDFDLDSYMIQPIRVGRTEELETSYNKRESVCSESRQALKESVAQDTIEKWCKACTKVRKKNDGESIKKWFVDVAEQFATDKVLATERYVMLTPANYYALLDSMTDNEALAFSASADVANGVLGKLLGFSVVQDFFLPAGVDMLAWQKNSVGVAKGEPELFVDEGSATMYGDVISGQERAGGTVVRKDAKGVYLVNATGEVYAE
nr:MAG TPA: coat protein [Caudoviricetes sp.]